jgi:hypothetical protein
MTAIILTCVGVTLIHHGLTSKNMEKRVLANSLLIIAIAEVRDLFVISLSYVDNVSAVMSNFGVVVW